MGNVMLIPARRQVGSNARKQEKKSQNSESQRTAASVQTAMSRLQVMKLRSSTTQNTFRKVLIGNLPESMLMTVSPAPTPKSEKNSIG